MMRWELICWCLIGSVGVWGIFELWPTTELCEFNSPGFVAKEIRGPDGHTHKYVLYVPQEYDSTCLLPLIIFLHSEADAGFDGRQQLKTGLAPEIWLRHRNNQPFPYFVLFPQSERPWSSDADDVQTVMKMLDSTFDEYRIDSDRIYLTGILSGNDALWKLAAVHPERWAALVPISCMTNQIQIDQVQSLPVRWYQNSCDNIENVRRTIAKLKEKGNSSELIEFDDLSQDAWTRAYGDHRLYDWLRRQVRHPRAKYCDSTVTPGAI